MNKYDRFFLKIKISFIVFFIAFVMAVRYGIPYIFEKYGIPTEAVVTNVGPHGSHGIIVAKYEFIAANGNFYTGRVTNEVVQVGDTLPVWYFLDFPWLNFCNKHE